MYAEEFSAEVCQKGCRASSTLTQLYKAQHLARQQFLCCSHSGAMSRTVPVTHPREHPHWNTQCGSELIPRCHNSFTQSSLSEGHAWLPSNQTQQHKVHWNNLASVIYLLRLCSHINMHSYSGIYEWKWELLKFRNAAMEHGQEHPASLD